ncbi:hypothetical protein BST81_15605 [Leptolyngbya sp. 'hensonii']|uniref:FecR family protein n=1 Tax=Leptolyngbya sp. 'hensonii' TaxID=1922337 RepID=UPI00094F7A41|nr:FecR domain-containing protein [Leptolyngbya sp. 'hensonii']OLP17742.1 hypothetical protein BST81_15605 [Leptolyngbya sp. 'hensonii']
MHLRAFTIATLLILLGLSQSATVNPLPVRVDRWLAVQQLSGAVAYYRKGKKAQTARIGDRLELVGDGIKTAQSSGAMLQVDTNIGQVLVLENTALTLTKVGRAPDNGRITYLQVDQGQVRLKLRRFTHRGSKLEIQTPAGISGVRGTEFGLIVQPQGKTSIATLTGSVLTTARGQSIPVNAGSQNFTIPGEPPTPSVPLREDTSLRSRFLFMIEGGVRKVRLVGQVDPVNAVIVAGVPTATDRNGQFSAVFLVPSKLRIDVIVITPLGKRQVHELSIP